jgi:hypothetical protein
MNTLYYDDNLSIMAELMAFKDIWTWDVGHGTWDVGHGGASDL